MRVTVIVLLVSLSVFPPVPRLALLPLALSAGNCYSISALLNQYSWIFLNTLQSTAIIISTKFLHRVLHFLQYKNQHCMSGQLTTSYRLFINWLSHSQGTTALLSKSALSPNSDLIKLHHFVDSNGIPTYQGSVGENRIEVIILCSNASRS